MYPDIPSLFEICDEEAFNEAALSVFRYQAAHTAVYRQYLELLGKKTADVRHYADIPFLPIAFFKTQHLLADQMDAKLIFSSSGTTGSTTSQHFVAEPGIYESSYNAAFRQFYGEVKDTAILALLPSYQERTGSSLIYMVDDLINQSSIKESGYFLYNHAALYDTLIHLRDQGRKTVLFGVTYALLDFIERAPIHFPELIVMETGGMKGRRKELIREELHGLLRAGFGIADVHSEYGMTELLSQAYSYGNGLFQTPPWMKVLMRDTNDPLTIIPAHKTGAINIIDLANVYSCSFIATQDLGRMHADGQFEVLGRFDNSDIRGCNLLVQ